MSRLYLFYANFNESVEEMIKYHLEVLNYNDSEEYSNLITIDSWHLSISRTNKREKERYSRDYGIDPKLCFDYLEDKFKGGCDIDTFGTHLMFMMNDFKRDVIYNVDGRIYFIRKNDKIYVNGKVAIPWANLLKDFGNNCEIVDKELYSLRLG